MDDLHSKRELNKGFASATSRGFELMATVAIFAGIGWALDRWLGTGPAFLIVFIILAFAGNFARMYYAYNADMARLEAELPGRSTSEPAA